MNEIVKKYEKMGFINDNDNDKEKLALIFDDTIKWLISIENSNTDNLSILFFPLIKILYKDDSFSYKEEFYRFEDWMNIEGEIWKKDINNINDFDLIRLYINDKNK